MKGTDSDQTGESGDNNIQVFIRIRPPGPDEHASSRAVEVDEPSGQIVLKHAQTPKVFTFDYVADVEASQETIFNHLGKKVIDNCIAGYNGTIFAYGQTGSGKTFTMLGPSDDCDNLQNDLRGVIPRSFEYLFSLINREKEKHGADKEFLCKCSFLEIYKEQIFDLLGTSEESLQLRESFKTGVYVAGLSERDVSDASEAYEVLNSSWANRRVGETLMNRESSRSHAVFTLTIESKKREGAISSIKTSMLHLVDLAGSERQKDTGASGQRLKEAGSINKSLSNLGNVIMALVNEARDGKKRFVPYRDSKLTFLLRDSLGGNSKTSLIACIHSGQKCLGETLSTLHFAKRAKMIKNKAVKNENAHGNIKDLQEEIRKLKIELNAYKDNIPEGVTSATVNDPNLQAFKTMFIKAMILHQKVAAEKKELYEELNTFKTICDKKDKALMSSKMIIKFRENTIKKLESNSPDAIEERISDLKDELQILRKQIENNPDVLKYRTEVKNLKANIRALKSEAGIIARAEADYTAVEDLEQKYEELMAETKQTGFSETFHKRESLSSGPADPKLKTHIEQLESTVEELKQQLLDKQEEAKRTETLLLTDVEASKKQVQELEALMSANQSTRKLEKAALTEQHRNTVKSLSTPKKERYKLRSRTVLNSDGTPNQSVMCNLEESLTEADDGILDEGTPLEMLEQANDTLNDELKKYQTLASTLEGSLASMEAEKVRIETEKEAAEEKMNLLEEFLEKEKRVSTALREELHKAERKVKDAFMSSDTASDEIKDLKTVLASADRELAEQKRKVQEVEKIKTEVTEKFEAKLMEIEVILQKQTKEIEKMSDENLDLDLRLAIAEEANDLLSSVISTTEGTVKEKEAKITDLEQKLMNAEQNLLDEKDLKDSLIHQLNSEELEKNKELLVQISQNKELSAEINELKNILDVMEDQKTAVQRDKCILEDKVAVLEKSLKLTEEKMSQLLLQQKDKANEVANLLQEKAGIEEHLQHQKAAEEAANLLIEELKETVLDKNKLYVSMCSEKQTEIDSLLESMKSIQNALDDMCKAAEESQNQLTVTQEREKTAKEEVERLKELLLAREQQDDKDLELTKLTEQLEHLQQIRAERQHEISQLKEKLQESKTTEMMMKADLDNSRAQLEESQACMERLQAENKSLQSRLKSSEDVRSDTAAQVYKYMMEETKLKNMVATIKGELQDIKRERDGLKETKDRLTDLADKDEEEKRNLVEENQSYKNVIKSIQSVYNDLPTEDYELQNLVKCIKTTKEEHKKLMDENCAIAGHHNPKQRIRHLECLKSQIADLKKDKFTLEVENHKLHERLEKGKVTHQRSQSLLKENIVPLKGMFFSEINLAGMKFVMKVESDDPDERALNPVPHSDFIL